MVVGENMKESDMELNAVREKELNNIRTKAHEEIIRLNPPKKFSIEEAISYARGNIF
jgi:GTP-binding protein